MAHGRIIARDESLLPTRCIPLGIVLDMELGDQWIAWILLRVQLIGVQCSTVHETARPPLPPCVTSATTAIVVASPDAAVLVTTTTASTAADLAASALAIDAFTAATAIHAVVLSRPTMRLRDNLPSRCRCPGVASVAASTVAADTTASAKTTVVFVTTFLAATAVPASSERRRLLHQRLR